jgi:hypothetical protein
LVSFFAVPILGFWSIHMISSQRIVHPQVTMLWLFLWVEWLFGATTCRLREGELFGV